MAFLKTQRVTGLSARENINARSITQTTSTRNISGTYNRHQLLLADNFAIKGNINVSDNLLLGKLSDDGNAITITGDTTTRTITGSGSIEGATLAQTPNANLSGMSGTLGSGITFPSGHIEYIKSLRQLGYGNVGDQVSWYPTNMLADNTKTLYLTVSAAEHARYSKIKIEFNFDMRVNKDAHAHCDYRLSRWQSSTTIPGSPTELSLGRFGVVAGGTETYNCVSGTAVDNIVGLTGTIYYAIQYRNAAGASNYASTMYFGAGAAGEGVHNLIIYGIV
tara:strand:+ start:392 stop:1225 length:834 start_codon:yes stop_codon:yes gene_type:complete